jgi:ribokinase
MPRLGETLVGSSFHMGYGGKGANQAVMAARLGAQVTMVTKVGGDVFGEGAVRNYRTEGMETVYVLVDPDRASGVAPILVDDSAQNVIVVVPGANQALGPEDVRHASPAIRAAAAVVCQLEVPIETTVEAFRIAKTSGARTILNPAPAQPLPDALLALTDVCVPNEPEIEQLTRRAVTTPADAEEAARVLLRRGPRAVITTLGARGAVVVDQDGSTHVAPVRVDAVDPTGAGDAFIGSLAVFLAEGLVLREAARRANAVAALSVTRIGAQESLPRRAEVEPFLARLGLT